MGDSSLRGRIEALDPELFEYVEAQTFVSDRRALLALHSAVAATWEAFAYLEIGSYLGGSLQVLVRDPRCRRIISIDPRLDAPPDKRGEISYEGNTTERMRSLLASVPNADVNKLTTHDCTTDSLDPRALLSPHLCFIDGEHTDEAVLNDARFCASAIDGSGVIAFHDYALVESGIRVFLNETWDLASCAMVVGNCTPSGGGVFAIELGNRGVLKAPIVAAAIESTWHRIAWRIGCIPKGSPRAVLAVWDLMPKVDRAVLQAKRRLRLA